MKSEYTARDTRLTGASATHDCWAALQLSPNLLMVSTSNPVMSRMMLMSNPFNNAARIDTVFFTFS
jgi:hypothetical protein